MRPRWLPQRRPHPAEIVADHYRRRYWPLLAAAKAIDQAAPPVLHGWEAPSLPAWLLQDLRRVLEEVQRADA